MKSWPVFFLLTGFIAVSVFSFAVMNHEVCPGASNILNFAAFHIGAFKGFAAAVFTLLFLVLALGIIIVAHYKRKTLWAPAIFPAQKFEPVAALSRHRTLTCWLSLFEKRDPVLI